MKALWIALSALLVGTTWAQSSEFNPAVSHSTDATTDRLLIEWRTSKPTVEQLKVNAGLRKLGATLRSREAISAHMDVLQLDRKMTGAALHAAIASLQADPNVLSVSPDFRRHVHAIPADPLYAQQWYFQNTQPSATQAEQAWDITTGSASTVVAVIDTGVRFEHPDLGRLSQGGKLLDGYDFVSNSSVANDGDSRDADASDPGDWVSSSDQSKPEFTKCDVENSSWHGTRVSSLIAAATNDGIGMAGTSWSALILPVRVMGKCGGYDSDIIAGMRWAAGLFVPGVPINANPAKVINLSLGGNGTCTAAYQSAISEVIASGSIVVVSAGNDGTAVSVPANCSGVIAVTGVRHAGTKVGYSNLGPEATIAAPAGNCVNTFIDPTHPCQYQIVVATDSGTTTPAGSTYTDQVTNYNIGTSFSAPLVSGAVALMHSLNAQLSPNQFAALLQKSATPFPIDTSTTTPQCHPPVSGETENSECICTTQTCGAGMLNTYGAVLAAARPLAIIDASTTLIPGVSAALDASASTVANQRRITTYEWTVTNVTGAMPVIAQPSQPTTSIQVDAASQFTLQLLVTDDQGSQDAAVLAMRSGTVSPAKAPAVTKSGGGGGGAMDPRFLAFVCFVYLAVVRSVNARSKMSKPSSSKESEMVRGGKNRMTLL
jgi:serine protease